MRLGLWNRLAIVASVLTSLIAPTLIWLSISSDWQESRRAGEEICIRLAEQRPTMDEQLDAQMQCFDDAMEPIDLGWSDWFELLGGTLLACAFIYGLIWISVLAAKWVWRGRSVSTRSAD